MANIVKSPKANENQHTINLLSLNKEYKEVCLQANQYVQLSSVNELTSINEALIAYISLSKELLNRLIELSEYSDLQTKFISSSKEVFSK